MSKTSQRNKSAYDYGYQIGLGKARYDGRRSGVQQQKAFMSGRAAGIAARPKPKRSLWRRIVLMVRGVFR